MVLYACLSFHSVCLIRKTYNIKPISALLSNLQTQKRSNFQEPKDINLNDVFPTNKNPKI